MARSVYATIADIRAAGLTDTSQYPDSLLTSRLELASALADALTCQYFGPVSKTFIRNGRGRVLAEEPGHNKIIEITSLRTISREGDTTVVDSDSFTVQDRFIRLRPLDTIADPFSRAFRSSRTPRWAWDDANVEVSGVFGWLNLSTKFETTLDAPLVEGDTSVNLVVGGDVEARDLLLIDGRFWVIVESVTSPGPPAILAIGRAPKSAAAGNTVIRYGKVPLLVREAVIRTVVAQRFQPGSEDEQDVQRSRFVRREETDDYQIEFFAGASGTKGPTGTGDPVADSYLSKFRGSTVSATWVGLR